MKSKRAGALGAKQRPSLKFCIVIFLVAIVLALVPSSSTEAQPASVSLDACSDELRGAIGGMTQNELLSINVVLVEPRETGLSHGHRANRRSHIKARQRLVLDDLSSTRFEVRHQFRELSGFSAWASREAIAVLGSHPEVVYVDIDRKVFASLAQGVPLIGGDVAHTAGVTGNGVTVAVLDTGIDSDHPHLAGALVAEACFCDDEPSPMQGCCPDSSPEQTGPGSAEDDHGHGTEMTGVITSDDATHKGIAPNAKIVAVKVLDSAGDGNLSDIAAGLDWVLSDGIGLGVSVVNLSFSDTTEHSSALVAPCTGSNTSNAISLLEAAGVVVFASSGNHGYSGGISLPACAPDAISVASVFDANFGSINFGICNDTPAVVDNITCWSSTGAILDMLAPGAVTSTSQLGGGSGGEAGTSIASAYAAGQAALLLEADPLLTPSGIKTLMLASGPLVVDSDNGLSFPRADIEDALIALPEPGAQLGLIAGAAFLALASRHRRARTRVLPTQSQAFVVHSQRFEGTLRVFQP